MLRFWLKKSGNGRRALVFSCNLLAVFLFAFAGGQDYERLEKALANAPTPSAKRELLNKAAESNADLLTSSDSQVEAKVALVKKEALLRRLAKPMAGNPANEAKRIRESNPFYREKEDREGSNWVKRAFENLWELIKKLFPKSRQGQPPNTSPPDMSLLGYAVIVLGVAALAIAIFLIVGQIKLRADRRAKSTSTALMDEEEPDRTLDEWLQMADDLEAQGKYREAVRALFLASLMKIDEAGVARFNRRQTNWEHLARIEVSPTRPAELEFRRPTKEFDRIWYGYDVRGISDVQEFRALYLSIKEMLARRVR